jgi:hypothetical protein
MKKKSILSLILIVLIILILGVLMLFISNPTKDVDVKVLEIHYQNNQYFVNVTIKNNQDKTGWIADMYLLSFQGSKIDLTGAGAGFKIEPGKKINLTLWSAEVQVSITDAPYTLTYTVFPSGNEYTVEI